MRHRDARAVRTSLCDHPQTRVPLFSPAHQLPEASEFRLVECKRSGIRTCGGCNETEARQSPKTDRGRSSLRRRDHRHRSHDGRLGVSCPGPRRSGCTSRCQPAPPSGGRPHRVHRHSTGHHRDSYLEVGERSQPCRGIELGELQEEFGSPCSGDASLAGCRNIRQDDYRQHRRRDAKHVQQKVGQGHPTSTRCRHRTLRSEDPVHPHLWIRPRRNRDVSRSSQTLVRRTQRRHAQETPAYMPASGGDARWPSMGGSRSTWRTAPPGRAPRPTYKPVRRGAPASNTVDTSNNTVISKGDFAGVEGSVRYRYLDGARRCPLRERSRASRPTEGPATTGTYRRPTASVWAASDRRPRYGPEPVSHTAAGRTHPGELLPVQYTGHPRSDIDETGTFARDPRISPRYTPVLASSVHIIARPTTTNVNSGAPSSWVTGRQESLGRHDDRFEKCGKRFAVAGSCGDEVHSPPRRDLSRDCARSTLDSRSDERVTGSRATERILYICPGIQ